MDPTTLANIKGGIGVLVAVGTLAADSKLGLGLGPVGQGAVVSTVLGYLAFLARKSPEVALAAAQAKSDVKAPDVAILNQVQPKP